jgi:hypothetical protein
MASQNRKRPLPPRRTMRAVLQALRIYFALRSKDLAAILRKREPTKNDLRTINRSLKLLDDDGLVFRLRYLNPDNDGVGYICGLTDRAVQEYGGKTFDEHSERTVDHELEISYFHMALQAFCDESGLTLGWRQADLKHDGIDPDSYFFISGPKGTNHFFLEFERAKLGSLKVDVDGKKKYGLTKKLEHYYSYYNTPACEKRWGFKTFRVILFMKSAERRDNRIDVLHQTMNHRMFWIGTKANYLGDFHTPKADTFSFSDL